MLRFEKGNARMRPDYATMTDLPAPTSTRLLDFEHIAIRTLESFPPQHVLVVSGTKPFVNMEVTLEPLVFIRQPEYWGIEVVGRLPGVGLPALAPYQVSIPLAGITGTKGIEVIGATRTERRDIPPQGTEAATLVFSRDDRPVDGALKELVVVQNAEGTFDATLRTAFFDRINGVEVDETEEIGSGLTKG